MTKIGSFLLFGLFFLLSWPLLLAQSSKEVNQSIIIEDDWSRYFSFVTNIGNKAQNFEELLFQKILNFQEVESLERYQSPETTRFLLSTYELQHRGVLDFTKMALQKGYHFQIIVDGNLLRQYSPLSLNKLETLSKEQKAYYFHTFDQDGDGLVDQADMSQYQQRYALTRWCWRELKKLEKIYPQKLSLISSPSEVIIHPNLNYPRIHHWKEYTIQFYEKGKWQDQRSFIPSSNLTNTCLNHQKGRISSSYVNFLRYTRAPRSKWLKALREGRIRKFEFENYSQALSEEEKFSISFAKTKINSQTNSPLRNGHVQFGQFFTLPMQLNKFKSEKVANWIQQYQREKFFDTAPIQTKQYPEYIFKSPNGSTSRLLANISEGVQQAHADRDFVNTAYNSILSDPGNSIRVFKSSQFVATHPKIIKKIQQAISQPQFEDFFMAVDGNFSTETYSALHHLVSDKINDHAFTPWTKSILVNELSFEKKQKTLKSLYSYDGHDGIYGGRDGVKLHAKVSYLEYVDSHKHRHYVVIHGSGNLSVNAGKGNADGLIVFDTTDPELKEQITPYFDGLKNNPRTKPFLETLLQKRFAHMIHYNKQADIQIEKFGHESSPQVRFIEENYPLLNISEGLLTSDLASILRGETTLDHERVILKKISSALHQQSNQTAFSKNFNKIFKIFLDLKQPLRLDQLQIIFYLANPQNHPFAGFKRRVILDWSRGFSPEQKKTFSKKISRSFSTMARYANSHQFVNLDPTAREIMKNCNQHFLNLGLNDFNRIKQRKE